MIAAVTGGRTYDEEKVVFDALDEVDPDFIIVGNTAEKAQGADLLCIRWAITRRMPYAAVSPYWDVFGLGAGPIRNGWMLLLKPDLVVAFPGGNGTADMLRKAFRAGITVRTFGLST